MMCDVSRLRDYVTGGTFPLCPTWCALQCLFDAILLLRWHLPTLSHLMWAVVLVWWNILQSTCCWGENIFSTLLLATRWVLSRVRSAAISRPLIGHWPTPRPLIGPEVLAAIRCGICVVWHLGVIYIGVPGSWNVQIYPDTEWPPGSNILHQCP